MLNPLSQLLVVTALLRTCAVSAALAGSVTVWTWPLNGTPQQLAEVSLDATTSAATVKTYTPPQPLSDADASTRVGLFNPSTSEWRGIVTSSSVFDPAKQVKLYLHVDSADQVYHLGWEALPASKGASSASSAPALSVEIVRTKAGPVPHLNKPVVLSADGKTPDKEPEKTFLQK